VTSSRCGATNADEVRGHGIDSGHFIAEETAIDP